MGRDFREVAKEITSALNLGEDEGKIDALAGSFQDAAIKSFGHNSELQTKLIHSINHTHKASVSRCVMCGGGGVTAQQHWRSRASGMLGSAGRTTDLADSFGAGS